MALTNTSNSFHGVSVSGPGTRLQIGGNGSQGNGTIALGAGTGIKFTTADTYANSITVAGASTFDTGGVAISHTGLIADGGGSGTVEVTGGGTLTLTNATNSYSGGTVVKDGSKLSVAANGALGAASGSLTLGDAVSNGTLITTGTFTMSRAVAVGAGGAIFDTATGTTLTASGAISGAGELSKAGAGTLVLSNDNSAYGGTVNLTAGTLTAGHASNALGVGVLNLNGGVLSASTTATLGNSAVYVGASGASVAGAQNLTISNGGVLSGLLTVTSTATTNLNGAFSGAGGITMNATGGTLVLGGANTYSGATTVTAGTLRAGAANAFSAGSATTISSGGTLDLGGFAQVIDAVSLSGGTLKNGSLTGAVTSTGGTIDALGGSAGVTASSGTTTVTGVNGYTGATVIGSGATLATSAGGSIASSSGVQADGTLDLSAATSATSIKTLSGSGSVTLDSTYGIHLTAASTEFSGAITGGGGLQVASGTFSLSGTNTYANVTQIDSGATLALKNGGSVSNSQYVAVNGGTFDISQATAGTTVRGIFDNGGSGSVLLGSKTLTLSVGSTFQGIIADGGIGGGTAGNLTIANGASQTLTGVNTYTGVTTIDSGGELKLSGAGSIATSSNVAVNGALDISGTNSGALIKSLSGASTGTVTLGNKTLTLTAASGTYSGALGVSGDVGGFVVSGGTATLANATVGYAGSTSVSSGASLVVTGTTSLAASSDVVVDGALDMSGLSGPTTMKSLSGASGGTVALGVNTLTLNAGSGTFAGDITGLGGFTLTSGNQTLSGNNAYFGATTINGGTLQAGSGTGLSRNSAFTVAGGAAIDLNGFDATIGSLAGAGTLSLGAKTLTAGGDDSSTVFSGVMSGATGGQLVKAGTGTLTISGVNSYTGVTTVNAGTLALTATGAIVGGLVNNATVDANGGVIDGGIANAGTFNVAGTVTSNAAFSNALGATLALTGTADYTLQGLLSNSGSLTVATGGQLTATAAGIINGATGTITNAGTIHDDLNNAGIVNNNGAFFGHIATNTGTITNNATWTGNVLSNTGRIINAAGATFAGNISNGGTFDNAGTITGSFTNTAGIFTNTGTIGGTFTLTGGTLTGTGSVGTLNIGSGGSYVAGNGTASSSTSVTGNLAFQSGASYLVALNPTTSSSANVGGTATLGGATVNALFASGTYVTRQYTILTATGGVVGTFATIANTNLPAGFTSALSYDAKNAYLDLTLNLTPLGPSGPVVDPLTTNQRNVSVAVVNYFNANGSIPIVFGALTPAGLTQVSGELGTGAQQTTIDAMTQFMGVMTDPFTAGPNISVAAPAFADEAMAYAAKRKPSDALAAIYNKVPPVAPAFQERWNVWAAGFGGSRNTDGNAVTGSSNVTSSAYGTAVGADYWLSPTTVAGVSLAGGGTNFAMTGNSGRSDLFQAGAFLRHNEGSAYITAAAAYGWQDITTDRTVTVAGIDRLRAQFNANSYSARIEGGNRYVTSWLGGAGVTPYAAVQAVAFDLPSYAENAVSGASVFALNYAAKTATSTRSELGLRGDKSFAVGDAILTLRGRAAWAHEYMSDRSVAATFQSLPGASFVVNGAAPARNAALTTASAEMTFIGGLSLAATFEGEFSDVTQSYAGKGVVRYAW